MEIPNLNPNPIIRESHPISLGLILIIVIFSLSFGFWGSRFFPLGSKTAVSNPEKALVIDPESLKSDSQIEVGKTYGNISKSFKDGATGVLEKGSINGEGTHILVREGGLSQRASLTSSVIDLDLFVGKKVEIKGETNSSNKTSWLLDVGTIKIVE
jgi:hypothetical protein